MNFIQKNAIGLVAIVIALCGLFMPVLPSGQSFAGYLTGTPFPNGLSIGLQSASPTNVAQLHVGSCSLIGRNFTSLVASTTLAYDCAITGVLTTDIVFASFPTTTDNGAGWLITQASASSTAGFITVRVLNNTGTAATIPASIASSTYYIAVGTQ